MSFSPRYPWERDARLLERAPEPDAVPVPSVVPSASKPRGRRPLASAQPSVAGVTSPDWIYAHHLTISGAERTARAVFAAAARGAGVIPWQLDFARIEEDIFVRAVAQPPQTRRLTVAGCRILARQFRDRVEIRQAKALVPGSG